MIKQYQHFVGGLQRLLDAFIIGAIWLSSYWFRFNLPLIKVTKGFPAFEKYAALLPLVMLLWVIVFESQGLYRSRRLLRRTEEIWLVLKAHSIALTVFISLTYLFIEFSYSRAVTFIFGGFGLITLVVFRLGLRNVLRHIRRRGINLRTAVLVGDGPAAEFIADKVKRFPELGLRLVGIISDQPKNTIARLGTLDEFEAILSKTKVDQVLLALHSSQYTKMDKILKSIQDETVDIKFIPDVHEYVTIGCEVEDFEGLPIVNLNESPLAGWSVVFKRVTDLVLSLAGLIVLSPLLAILAILVKLTSPGPVFYRQKRMGIDGKVFEIFKFRSMSTDAESKTGAVWAQPSDSRRTRLGRFLRATSLDELPQLWNVVCGQMSLVGPRPERPVFVEEFRKNIPHYMLRHKVKAGITGWAQVNGWRGNTSLEKRIEFDLYYVRNWSFGFDVKILIMTFWKGFLNRNAY